MANSCKPGSLNPPLGICRVPARTPGPLGFMDQGDPNVTTLLGDTPGPLGFGDWGDPTLPGGWGAMGAGWGFARRAGDGTALAVAQVVVPTALSWADIEADFQRWEKSINYMYLDIYGNVTVGVGNMLPSVASAQALPFVRRSDGAKASAKEIQDAFDAIRGQPHGVLYAAPGYKDKTVLELPERDSWTLFHSRIEKFLSELSSYFSGWEQIPTPAKRALLDMAYNLGMGSTRDRNGLREYVVLKRLVDASDWRGAAEQCLRRGEQMGDRNAWTRALFLEADALQR